MNTESMKTEVATVEQRSVAVTPMEMLQIAVERGADLDQLQKLMDLQERWEANEARKAFVAALSAFKADPPEIIKDRPIKHNEKLIAKYAGLDQVSEAIGKGLSKHGLSHRWDTEQLDDGSIRVTCILTHDKGHSERTTLKAAPDQTGAKNSVQAIGSTVTYLERYTLLAATGMATSEMDDDGAGSASINDEQKAAIIELMRKAGVDDEHNTRAFLQFMGVNAIDNIPASDFMRAINVLKKKEQKG